MTLITDLEATNSPRPVGVRETELPFEFDWAAQGTPTAVDGVVLYDAAGTAVANSITGTPTISGDKITGITLDGSKLTPPNTYYLVCLATISGRERGMFCRILSRSFP